MARTDSMRRQHKDILVIVGEINEKISQNNPAETADDVRRLLSTLGGKLVVHLAVEDKNLYPIMMDSDNATAKEMAQAFSDEMGEIGNVFKAYSSKWNSSKFIQENYQEFVSETKAVFTALGQRVEREETQLYPLADTL